MSVLPAKEWTCNRCTVVQMQTGPRAMEMLPTPPIGWVVVDVTRTTEPKTVGEGDAKVKVKETRQTTRETFCPECAKRLGF